MQVILKFFLTKCIDGFEYLVSRIQGIRISHACICISVLTRLNIFYPHSP